MRLLVGIRILGELGPDDVGAPHQLDDECARQRGQGLHHAGDLRLRGGVAPHSVHRHADHPQASSTSTCFFPR